MIVCGTRHTVIQNEKNEIYVCGYNTNGQFGLDNNKTRDKFEKVEHEFGKIKKIVCGGNHTIIQNKKNEIYVCGREDYGKLDLGDNKSRYKFEKIDCDFGEIKNIACGVNYIVIQNEKNEIYVRGCNGCGQLGLGDYCDRNIFEKVNFEFGKIKNIECGGFHTVIQNEKNEIYVCGRNGYGQLGLCDNHDRNIFEKVNFEFGEIKNIACSGYYTVIQNGINGIYVCGDNRCGQLGLGDEKNRNMFEKVEHDFGEIKNIACGGLHIVIQNEKNEIYVCGYNEEGQLGLGDYKNRNTFEKVEYDFGEIKNIACFGFHTVIQNELNELYVCGSNRYGQLGLGDDKNRNIFEKVNTNDIFEKIYNFELRLNTKEIDL